MTQRAPVPRRPALLLVVAFLSVGTPLRAQQSGAPYFSGPRPGLGAKLDCSQPGWTAWSLPGARRHMASACIYHDLCYRHGKATYGYTRDFCDSAFARRMFQICDKQYPGTGENLECHTRAGTMHNGVSLFAASHFHETKTEVAEFDWTGLSSRRSWERLVDVDGDGDLDVVFTYWAEGGLRVRTKEAIPPGFSPHSALIPWGPHVLDYPVLAGDIDGDGRGDLVFVWSTDGQLHVRTLRANPDFTWTAGSSTLGAANDALGHPIILADIDGDRRADLVFLREAAGDQITLTTAQADGAGGFIKRGFYYTRWSSEALAYGILVGDVDGDERADLIAAYDDWDRGLQVSVLMPRRGWGWEEQSRSIGWGRGVLPAMLGDVDADGRSDLVFPYQDPDEGLTVRLLTSTDSGEWRGTTEVIGWGSAVHEYPTLIGDFNGDTRADLFFRWNEQRRGLVTRVLLSSPSIGWNSKEQVIGWGPKVHQYLTLAGDLTGDGRMDILFPFQNGADGLLLRYLRAEDEGEWTPLGWSSGDGPGVINHSANDVGLVHLVTATGP